MALAFLNVKSRFQLNIFILLQTPILFGEKGMEKSFSAVITKEGKWFVGYCPELGVSSQGRTKKLALDNLKEAVELYLEKDPIGLPEKREVLEFKARVAVHA